MFICVLCKLHWAAFYFVKKNDVVGHVFDDDKITYSSSMPTLVMKYHQILKTDI